MSERERERQRDRERDEKTNIKTKINGGKREHGVRKKKIQRGGRRTNRLIAG